MPKVKVFVKEVIIHEKIVDMPDDLWHDYLKDNLELDTCAAAQMADNTAHDSFVCIHW